MDRISISIDGTDPVAFERERRGAKFDRILNNVSTLIDMRESGGYRIPKIRIQTVRLPEIDLNNYRSFWQNYCDEVAVVDYKAVEDRNQTIIDGNWACPQLWQRMTIEWDGTIMPCNNDDLRKISPGNAMEMPVKDCWHDQIVEQARKLHRQGKSHLIESCNGCPWRTTQINKRQRTAN